MRNRALSWRLAPVWTSLLFGILLLAAVAASASAVLPALTGRVVDEANILSPATRADLETKLADLETKSGIQLVVATVPTLDGRDIEGYANDLFRSWQLGEKTANNGVLLLIAPNDRRVRIEVGYGLEGTLTDALSKVIITNAITPRFKTGDFDAGTTRGVDDIITVLTTDAAEWEKRPSLRVDREAEADPMGWVLTALMIAFFTLFIVSPGFRYFVLNVFLNVLVNSGGTSGYSRSTRWDQNDWGGGGWSGGGGFSGGGGSSGGGGASGSW